MHRVITTLRAHRRVITLALVVVSVGLGFIALDHLTREIRLADVRAAFHTISRTRLMLALACTAISYLALTLFDVLALRVIGRVLPWRVPALASFTSYTLSHNLGMAMITGGSARYRIYTVAGLDGPDVARVVAIASATFWMGVVTVAGTALLVHPGAVAIGRLTLVPWVAHGLGGIVLLLAAILVFASGRIATPVSMFGFRIPLPKPRQALAQIAVACLDIGAASAALFVLIPGAAPALIPAFVLAYALGIIAAVATHVPGGLGVFEAVVLAIVPGDKATLFAALIAYRVVYYLVPLAIGILLLAWHEGVRAHSSAARRALVGAQALAVGAAPLLLGAATFLGGAMLLLSGSLPALHARIGALATLVPLPFIEASHIAGSLAGTGLLLLAPGLYRRLDGAFLAARALLVAGAVFSILKGVDYEEAIVCLAIAGVLQWTRAAFYRRTALTARPVPAGWLVSVASMFALATWAGFFAYRHVAYSDSLWWQFALDADAPRFLRAILAAAVLLVGAATWRLFAPAGHRKVEAPETVTSGTMKAILASTGRTEAMLAFLGDKRFLVSTAGDAFLMYRVEGASWIVMGDPVGAAAAWPELLWRIRDLADVAQGRLLLYQISASGLDLAIGMGLQIIKYGEEAIVDLFSFTVDVPRLRGVRRAAAAAARKGAEFRIVPAGAICVIMRELAGVSAEWMDAKGGREKGFSLGNFDPAYLSNFDVAVVRVGGKIVAFANLWLTANKAEASVDLMRYSADAPPGTMDFLFVNLLQWTKARGFARFSVGLAPLSGIEGRRRAPVWAKIAALLFKHGERFYGFRGLRAYKEKFAPMWEPRYIAGSHGIGLVQSLHDLSRIVNRPPSALAAAENDASGVSAPSSRTPRSQEAVHVA